MNKFNLTQQDQFHLRAMIPSHQKHMVFTLHYNVLSSRELHQIHTPFHIHVEFKSDMSKINIHSQTDSCKMYTTRQILGY